MRNWTKRADELANDYHNTDSNISRDRLRVEWYSECAKIAKEIQAARESERKRRDARDEKRGSSSKRRESSNEKPYFVDVFRS